jgi:hypothetical protein
MTGRSDSSAVTSDTTQVAEQLLKDISDELLTLEDLDADYDPEAYYYFTTTLLLYTTVYVSSCYYIPSVIPLCMCPHATIYLASSCYCVCVLMLYIWRLQPYRALLILLCMRHHTPINLASSYHCVCVPILVYIQRPHTTVSASSCCYICGICVAGRRIRRAR